MEESDIEGLATHDGPESCVGDRKVAGEALAGGVQAGLWSREINEPWGAHAVTNAEGNTVGSGKRELPAGPARSKNHGMYASSMRENREVPLAAHPPIRAGTLGEGQGRKPEMNGSGKSDSPVVPAKPANKAARGEAAHAQAAAESVERLEPVHQLQLLTYLRLSGRWMGLLLNFNTDRIKHGLRRLLKG